jgi:hypothetical protein
MHYFRLARRLARPCARRRGRVRRFWRDSPGFSQRFTGRFSTDGNTIACVWELCQEGTTWKENLHITYKRVA